MTVTAVATISTSAPAPAVSSGQVAPSSNPVAAFEAAAQGILGTGIAPAARAVSTATHAMPWSYIDEHGIRTLSLQAQELQTALEREFKALSAKEQKSPKVRADYATALAKLWADERGELSAEQFHPTTLSGYRLPPGKYVPETIQHLAMACAAMLTQSQVETAIRNLKEWS